MIVCNKKLLRPQRTERQHQQTSYALLIAWGLLFVSVFSSCSLGASPGPPPPPEYVCSTPTTKPVTLTMTYDNAEQGWIDAVVKDFNSQNMTACDGPIMVHATPMSSGQAMQHILNGKLQPDIWSPAGSAWLPLLNTSWHNKNGSDLISLSATNPPPTLITSPVVIAMWQDEAQALGWPRNSIGWSDIANLIADPKGWADYQHPEWGKFKFGNTSAVSSNAGLDTAIGMSYAAPCYASYATAAASNTYATPSCPNTGLTVDSVNSSSTKQFITTIEKSAISYGTNTHTLADQMFSHERSYLSAIAAEESLVVQANDKTKYPNLPSPLVAIYPKEGTVESDFPFAIVQGPWLSSSKNAAALVFRDFLLTSNEQAKAIQYGFRPTTGRLAAPMDTDHGINPTEPKSVLSIPDPAIVQAIETNWQQERRPFDVMLAVDSSGSMNFPVDNIPKIDGVKTGLKEFVTFMKDSDNLGLVTFSDHANIITDVTQLGPKRPSVLSSIDGVFADGGAQLFDTIKKQFQSLQQLPSTSKPIKALVVLSNQQDNQSSINLSQLLSSITPPADQNPADAIRIFTIAYGSGADTNTLTQIAQQTGGQEFSATPQNIQDVYEQIGELL